MTNIKREELHHNFLKSVIMRLDFQGVLEAEMDKILVLVKAYAKEHGFTRYAEKNVNKISIAVTEKESLESIETANQIRYQKVYSFINEDKGFVLDVASTFICLTVNTTHYTPFDSYCEIVPFVADIYDKSIDFFTVKRFGIRKINECLFKNKEQIRGYFNTSLFNYYDQLEEVNTIQCNQINTFLYRKHHINLATNIAQGKYRGELLYSVRLDIDAYLNTTEEVKKILHDDKEEAVMNDLIFQIYISSLSENFVKLLASDTDFKSDSILGIERND